MGMVQFMDEADNGGIDTYNYKFTVAAAIDEITPKIIQGNIDIAAVPSNLAAILYNNTQGKVQVLAIGTLGTLYIAESGDTIGSAGDLLGKTIYASGKGAMPEYALNYVLKSNGINPESDVSIEWKSEHTECAMAMAVNKNAIAMLPQPYATTAMNLNESIRIALDLTAEWEKSQNTADNQSVLIMGVVIARTEFAGQNPIAMNDFLDRYFKSVSYVNQNLSESARLIGKYEIVTEAVAQAALPYCNITFIEGMEMKSKLSGFLSVLFEQNPQSIGGALPDDAFYYSR